MTMIVLAIEEDEGDLPMLYIKSIASPYRTTAVPYFAEMPLWEYLATVLAPRAGTMGRQTEDTVYDTFLYNNNGKQPQPQPQVIIGRRANRLIRLGDSGVPPGATLHHTGLGGGERGNATRGDVTEPCAICLAEEVMTDFELPGCGHRFHAQCIGAYVASRSRAAAAGGAAEARCPICRGPM